MSADNGIYILKHQNKFFVAHAQAIENIFEDEESFKSFLRSSEVFQYNKAAWMHARYLAEDYDILEYGISEIEVPKFAQINP